MIRSAKHSAVPVAALLRAAAPDQVVEVGAVVAAVMEVGVEETVAAAVAAADAEAAAVGEGIRP